MRPCTKWYWRKKKLKDTLLDNFGRGINHAISMSVKSVLGALGADKGPVYEMVFSTAHSVGI